MIRQCCVYYDNIYILGKHISKRPLHIETQMLTLRFNSVTKCLPSSKTRFHWSNKDNGTMNTVHVCL